MSTARTLRPRVDFGDDHDAGGALSCLPCCRPDEILHSLVGAPVPPPDARQAVSAHVEEAFSLFAELNEYAGGLPRLQPCSAASSIRIDLAAGLAMNPTGSPVAATTES